MCRAGLFPLFFCGPKTLEGGSLHLHVLLTPPNARRLGTPARPKNNPRCKQAREGISTYRPLRSFVFRLLTEGCKCPSPPHPPLHQTTGQFRGSIGRSCSSVFFVLSPRIYQRSSQLPLEIFQRESCEDRWRVWTVLSSSVWIIAGGKLLRGCGRGCGLAVCGRGSLRRGRLRSNLPPQPATGGRAWRTEKIRTSARGHDRGSGANRAGRTDKVRANRGRICRSVFLRRRNTNIVNIRELLRLRGAVDLRGEVVLEKVRANTNTGRCRPAGCDFSTRFNNINSLLGFTNGPRSSRSKRYTNTKLINYRRQYPNVGHTHVVSYNKEGHSVGVVLHTIIVTRCAVYP